MGGWPPEIKPEPAGQVPDLVVDRGGHRPGERDVLVDRGDPEHAGITVGGRVQLAHQRVAEQDRQAKYPHRRLAAGLYISSW
jgi:hypothetical protein